MEKACFFLKQKHCTNILKNVTFIMNMKHVSLLALTFPNINSLNHLQVLYLRPLTHATIELAS